MVHIFLEFQIDINYQLWVIFYWFCFSLLLWIAFQIIVRKFWFKFKLKLIVCPENLRQRGSASTSVWTLVCNSIITGFIALGSMNHSHRLCGHQNNAELMETTFKSNISLLDTKVLKLQQKCWQTINGSNERMCSSCSPVNDLLFAINEFLINWVMLKLVLEVVYTRMY